jgi:hypothetical protein
MNSSPTITCSAPCLSANPDANDGSTAGSTLGTGWACFGGIIIVPPVGDDPNSPGVSDASITCAADLVAPVTLLTNDPGLLATITFTATGGGVENLVVTDASNVFGQNCGSGITCAGATITKQGAVANTPTAPAATSTPCVVNGATCTPPPGQIKTVTPTPSPVVDASATPGEPGGGGEPTVPGGQPGAGGATPPTGIVGPDTGSGGYLHRETSGGHPASGWVLQFVAAAIFVGMGVVWTFRNRAMRR